MLKTKILLFLPIFVLLAWTLSVQSMIARGTKLDLPVRGYDPRDILAGHYLSVAVDYSSFPSECKTEDKEMRWKKRDAFFCASSGRIVWKNKRIAALLLKVIVGMTVSTTMSAAFMFPRKWPADWKKKSERKKTTLC